MHDILAALAERVQTHKQSICRDLPLVLALRLVIEVGLFESGAHVDAQGKAAMGFLGSITSDSLEDALAVHEVVTLSDNSVADLADQDHQAGRCVVVAGIGPNHEDGVHDGHEGVSDLSELLRLVSELVEELLKGRQVFEILIGLGLCRSDLLMELGKSGGVSALVLLQEFEYLLDAFTGQLIADRVEIFTLVLPEVELFHGIWVLA